MNKETIVPLADLNVLAVECPECKAVVMLDLDREHKLQVCVSCEADLPDSVRKNVATLAGAIVRMRESKCNYSFRVADKGTEK